MILAKIDEQYNDEHLDALKIWHSPVPHLEPTIKSPRGPLRIACILSSKLYQDLKFEASLLLLTKQNWYEILKFGKPDFLLIDSFWATVTGDWYLSQTSQSESLKILNNILDVAKALGIPTVYWNTEDYLYRNVFLDFSLNFDFIFCSDSRVAEVISKQFKNVEILAPAIQPALYNPFRNRSFVRNFKLDIVFDGWADILRLDNQFQYLTALKDWGLSIIDSNFVLFKSKLSESPDFAENILGYVGFFDRLMALKYSTLSVMDQCTILTPIRQIWKSLEVAACRLPLLYRGRLSDNDLRKNIVMEFSNPQDLIKSAENLLKDTILRESMAQSSWRNTHNFHTITHRINSICEILKINQPYPGDPLVSVIIATFRPHLLKKCIEQYDRQTYPNKELILVINSNTFEQQDIIDLIGTREDISFFILPTERVAGGCLNLGIMSAKGEHCIKMDDDDFYGDNYVLDFMLHNRSVNADVYGKSNRFFHFEDNNTTYERLNNNRPQLTLIDQKDIVASHIGGNTLSGRADFLKKHNYSDTNFGSVDTHFHFSMNNRPVTFAFYDDLSVIVERGSDVNDHSWRYSNEKLKKRMQFIGEGLPPSILG